MTIDYLIVGGGCFGLHVAFFLNKFYPNKHITLIDYHGNLNATINSGFGSLKYSPKINISGLISLIDIKNINVRLLSWLFNFGCENILNMKNNRKIMIELSKLNKLILAKNNLLNNNYVDCNDSSYYKPEYFTKLKEKLINNGIQIINDDVIEYEKINNIYNALTKNKKYVTKNIILAQGSFIRDYHNLIKPVQGYSLDVIINKKEFPKCFHKTNNIFISPLKDNIYRITCKAIFTTKSGYSNNVDINEKNNIVNYLIQNKIITENTKIIKFWTGTRPMTYDALPFFDKITDNLFIINGGSFLGTHFAGIMSYWLVDYIKNNKINNDIFNPLHTRLIKKKQNYTILLFTIIIVIYLIAKTVINKT